jgi:transcription initiation factor TFIID subunit 2
MDISKQKNVYYIDLNQSEYRGYVQTYLNTGTDLLIRYRFSALEITAVVVYHEGEIISTATVTIEYLKDKMDDKFLFQNSNSDYLNIRLTESYINSNLKIKIEYKLGEHNTDVLFYQPVSINDGHKEIVTINKLNNSSGIFPSIETAQSYRWELVYIYSSLEELKVISPGVLKNFVEDEDLSISSYVVENCCSGFLNFSVGTYDRFEIFNGDDKKVIFCPLNMNQLKDPVNEIIEDFSNIIKYVEYFIQMPYPLESLNVLFTLLEIDKTHSLDVAIYNISYIATFNDIEPKFIIKRIIAEIVASQIFYFHVNYEDITDYWIFCGLKGYLEDYCVRILLGNNEFLFQYKNDKDYIIANDVYELPLCDEKRDMLSYESEFFIKKSRLVFHTLENNLSKAFLEKICHFLIEKRNNIGKNFSADFLSLIKDITGKDMRQFFEFYVFRPGFIKANFKFTIDTKKNKVDFKIVQEPTSKIINRNERILGNVTLMSYEVEGCFEHVFNPLQNNYFYYHIRTKKRKKVDEEEDDVMPLLWMRVDPKREHILDSVIEQPDYMYIEQALDKNVIGQLEALEQLFKSPSIQICEVLERILDNSHVFYKVRIKVMYILSRINIENFVGFQRLIQFFTKKYFVQSSTVVKPNEFMFVNYFLQKHCVRALSLTDPFLVKNYNGRDVSSATVVCSFIINILKFNDNSANSYNDSWYIASVIENLSHPILALQFANLPENIQQEAYESFTTRTTEIEPPIKPSQDLSKDYDFDDNSSDDLKEIFDEDNSKNVIFEPEIKKAENSDEKNKFIKDALEEVERYRILDMIFPSHKNIITEATIYLLGRLSIYGCIGMKKETLISFSRYPNSIKIRKAALIMLILLYNEFLDVMDYLLDVLKNDIMYVKIIILDSWINLLGIRSVETKNELIKYQTEIKNMMLHNPYDVEFKMKINEILMFLDNKDVSVQEYNEKIVELCKNRFNDSFYMNKIGTDLNHSEQKVLKIRLKNFKEMKMQVLSETYLLKLSKPKKEITVQEKKPAVSLTKKDKSVKDSKTEVKFESNKSNIKDVLNDENQDVPSEMKNTRLEDNNLEEMLKFEELSNNPSPYYTTYNGFGANFSKDIEASSNDLSSMNLSKTNDNFNKLVNYENDSLDDKSLNNTKSTINKLFEDFRNVVSENSRKSDSGSFSEIYNYLEPEFGNNYDDLYTKSTDNYNNSVRSHSPTDKCINIDRETSNMSYPNTRNIFSLSAQNSLSITEQPKAMKNDIEKFLLDDDNSEESGNYMNSCKTQKLEERDFDRQFGKIEFESPLGRSDNEPYNNDLYISDVKKSSSLSSKSGISDSFSMYSGGVSPNIDYHDDNDNFYVKKYPLIPLHNLSPTKNPIEDFLDSEEGLYSEKRKVPFFRGDFYIPKAYRYDEFKIRFSVRTKIRIPGVDISDYLLVENDKKKRGRKRKEEVNSPNEFYSSKKTCYQISNNDLITRRLFYGTISNLSIKQVNKVIFKNKTNSFFDWRPKTFKEIEVHVNNESKYKKICKEMERSLVFALSYSQFGSRTFNIAKKLFDTYEIKHYETYAIPSAVHPLSAALRNCCVDFLNKIYLNEKFVSFIRPVNISGLDAYLDIVRSPMCLDIVQKKMIKYSTVESFYGDIKQIIKNCCHFNQNDSEIVCTAKKLLKKTQEFDKYLQNFKKKVSSDEMIKLLLQRFEDSNKYIEIVSKYDNGDITTFYQLINEVRSITSQSMRKFISPQQLQAEIELFEDQIFHAFSVLNGKVYCWDIY